MKKIENISHKGHGGREEHKEGRGGFCPLSYLRASRLAIGQKPLLPSFVIFVPW